MNGETMQKHALRRIAAAIVASALLLGAGAHAQVPVDDDGNPIGSALPSGGNDVERSPVAEGGGLSAAELEDLVGPVALYPDDLLAIVLPASTYPLDIVQAARYLEAVEADPSLEPDEDWDDSIVALLNYPEVVSLMNDDIDWTWALGEAVVSQQADVILAIESFRDRAYAAGNLDTDDRQTVTRNDDGVIEIEPVEEDVIYVPYYEPERVVYYSPSPVYYYYPRAYPVYYYPYPRHHYLTSGLFWGVTTAFTIGWLTDHVHVYHHSYYGHPYYGRYYGYYGYYWRRPSINVYNSWYVNTGSPYYRHRYNKGDHWRPRHRSGSRPRTHVVDNGYYRNSKRRSRTDGSRYRNDYSDRKYGGNSYRDRRTDGKNFNAGTRTRGANGRHVADNGRTGFASNGDSRSNRATAGGSRRGGTKDAIRFRPRGDGSYSASREERVKTSRNGNQRGTNAVALTRRNGTDTRRGSRRATPGAIVAPGRNATTRARTRSREANRKPTTVASARPMNSARSYGRDSSAGRTAGFAASPQSRASAPRQTRAATPRQSRPSAPSRSRAPAPRQARPSAPSRSRAPAPRQSRPSAPSQSRASAPRSSRVARGSGSQGRQSGRPRNRN